MILHRIPRYPPQIRRFATAPDVDHYKTLDVKETATTSEIKTAFYEKSKQYHPDKNQDANAAVAFQKVAAAYEALGSEERRKAYDRERFSRYRSHSHHPSSSSPFRSSHKSPPVSRNYRYQQGGYAQSNIWNEGIRRARPEFGDPDEFFKRFGNRTFRSRLDVDDCVPRYRGYTNEQARRRELEEIRIMDEIMRERENCKFTGPIFESMVRENDKRRTTERLITNAKMFMAAVFLAIAGISFTSAR